MTIYTLFAAFIAYSFWEIRTLSGRISALERDNYELWEWVGHFQTITEPEEDPAP